MSRCTRVRELFGPYWDGETTRAERDWVEAHFAECSACRGEYDALTRTLSAVASLPRAEAAPELAERALAAARRAQPARDVVFVRPASSWVPVAAAAAVVLVVGAIAAPWVLHSRSGDAFTHASGTVNEPRLVAVAAPAGGEAKSTAPATASAGKVSVTISDTLFDHSEDVDFVLDPVRLRRGHAHTVARLGHGIQEEQAVITF